jgi:hypothetical protein
VSIDDAVLADSTRRLIAVPTRRPTPARTARALERLDAALDDIEQRIAMPAPRGRS